MTQSKLELDRHYIEHLEQHITELESPKTCEGCKWLAINFGCAIQDTFGNSNCIRHYNYLFDYYKQKDEK